MTKVLVVGPARSGTTWVGQALGRSEGTRYVHEPDGDHEPYALKAKVGHALQIELRPGDEARRYRKLWEAAFAGGKRSRSPQARLARRWFEAALVRDRNNARRGEHIPFRLRTALALAAPPRADPSPNVVAKSVHAGLCAEWIESEFAVRVVVVERHPLNVLSSWKQYGHGGNRLLLGELADYAARRWDLRLPVETDSRFARQVMSLGVLTGALHEAAARNPQWLVISHEALCVDPDARFRELVSALGLSYSDATATYLRDSNQAGEGYITKRVTKSLPSKWQRELTEDEIREASEVFDLFPYSLGLAAAAHKPEPPR
jgi:hypothetical protein